MDVAEWTGVLPAVMAARTQTEVVSFQRDHGRAVDIDMRQLVAGISGRHVEVMRGALAAALHESTRDDAEYRFEDSIRTIEQEPDGVAVTFEHGSAARFDLVIGADGLHSIVRRLTFGPEDRFRRFLGRYLVIFVLPNYLGLDRRMLVWNAPGRLAAIYPVRQQAMAEQDSCSDAMRRWLLIPVTPTGRSSCCTRSTSRTGGTSPEPGGVQPHDLLALGEREVPTDGLRDGHRVHPASLAEHPQGPGPRRAGTGRGLLQRQAGTDAPPEPATNLGRKRWLVHGNSSDEVLRHYLELTAPHRSLWVPHFGSPLSSRTWFRCLGVCIGACRRQRRSSGGALHVDGSGASMRSAWSRGRAGVRRGPVGG
jgi:hypothetical protein